MSASLPSKQMKEKTSVNSANSVKRIDKNIKLFITAITKTHFKRTPHYINC